MRFRFHCTLPGNRHPGVTFSKWLTLVGVWLLIFWCAVTIVSPVYAQEPTPHPTQPPALLYDEEEAQAIDGMLMCPVCPAESIDQAQVPLARQMRQLVREKLSQGESREEILEYFAGAYGRDILAAPNKSGVGLVAWTAPVIGVLAALTAGIFVLRSMAARPGRQDDTVTAEAVPQAHGLDPYLQAVDKELGLPEPPLPPPALNLDPEQADSEEEASSG